MGNIGHFNANDFDPYEGIEVLPNGWYPAQIIDSDVRETADGEGHYLWLHLEVIAGEHEGAPIFDRLNVHNKSEVAQNIAHRQLSSICRAVDIMEIDDSEELHFQPFEVRVAIRKTEEFGDQNDVKAYRPITPQDDDQSEVEPDPPVASEEAAEPTEKQKEKPKTKVNVETKATKTETSPAKSTSKKKEPSWRK